MRQASRPCLAVKSTLDWQYTHTYRIDVLCDMSCTVCSDMSCSVCKLPLIQDTHTYTDVNSVKAVAGSHELNVILKTAPTLPWLDHRFFWGRFVTALCGCLEWQWVEPEVVTFSYYLNQIVNAWVLLFLITPLLSFGFGLLFLRPVKTWMVTWQNADSLNVLHLLWPILSRVHYMSFCQMSRVGGKFSKWICYMKVAQDRLNEAESYESHAV